MGPKGKSPEYGEIQERQIGWPSRGFGCRSRRSQNQNRRNTRVCASSLWALPFQRLRTVGGSEAVERLVGRQLFDRTEDIIYLREGRFFELG